MVPNTIENRFTGIVHVTPMWEQPLRWIHLLRRAAASRTAIERPPSWPTQLDWFGGEETFAAIAATLLLMTMAGVPADPNRAY